MSLLHVLCKFCLVVVPSIALIAVVCRIVQNSAFGEKIKFFKGPTTTTMHRVWF